MSVSDEEQVVACKAWGDFPQDDIRQLKEAVQRAFPSYKEGAKSFQSAIMEELKKDFKYFRSVEKDVRLSKFGVDGSKAEIDIVLRRRRSEWDSRPCFRKTSRETRKRVVRVPVGRGA